MPPSCRRRFAILSSGALARRMPAHEMQMKCSKPFAAGNDGMPAFAKHGSPHPEDRWATASSQ